jgi:hypothetical protein
MKKFLLFSILTICTLYSIAQAASDVRTVGGCGYATKATAVAWAASYLANADETVIEVSDNTWQNPSTGKWCFSKSFICNPAISNTYSSRESGFDTRRLKKCGYADEHTALQAVMSVLINDDETAISQVIPDANNTGRYCYEIVIYCGSPFGLTERNNITILPEPTPLPALQPMKICTKTFYGPNMFSGYPSCQTAENGAAAWLRDKTTILLQDVDTFVWASGEGWENWGVTIKYSTGGSCY